MGLGPASSPTASPFAQSSFFPLRPSLPLLAGFWVGDAASASAPAPTSASASASTGPASAPATAAPSGHPARIAVMAAPGPEYTVACWAAWLAGGIVVPLALAYPPPELAYVLGDAAVSLVVCTADYAPVLAPLAGQARAPLLTLEALVPAPAPAPSSAPSSAPYEWPSEAVASALERQAVASASGRGALVIYTSGTTGRPKGVLHTHGSLRAQASSLAAAWEWSPDDVILHTLPLHHIHGIVNAWATPLLAGACVEFAAKFSPNAVWARLGGGGGKTPPAASAQRARPRVTVFMGVPSACA